MNESSNNPDLSAHEANLPDSFVSRFLEVLKQPRAAPSLGYLTDLIHAFFGPFHSRTFPSFSI
jgi:hypothetical protein